MLVRLVSYQAVFIQLTCLSTADNIVVLKDSRENVSLDGCRFSVTAELDVLKHDWVETSILELPKVSVTGQHCRKTGPTFFTG